MLGVTLTLTAGEASPSIASFDAEASLCSSALTSSVATSHAWLHASRSAVSRCGSIAGVAKGDAGRWVGVGCGGVGGRFVSS